MTAKPRAPRKTAAKKHATTRPAKQVEPEILDAEIVDDDEPGTAVELHSSARTGLAPRAVGDTIYLQMLRAVTGYGAVGDNIQIVESLQSEALVAGGYAVVVSSLSTPVVQPSPTSIRWQAFTRYPAGWAIINPSGQLVTANVDFVSGAAYVAGNWTAASGGGGAVSSVQGRTGAVTLTKADVTGTGLAAADIGATTAAAAHADAASQVAALVNAAPSTLDTLGEIAAQLGSDESAATALAVTVAGKMPNTKAAVIATGLAATDVNGKARLATSTVKTSAFTAAAWTLYPCDIASSSYAATLPAASSVPAGTEIAFKIKAASSTLGATALSVTPNGTDTINGGTAGAALAMRYADMAKTLVSDGTSNWTVSGGDLSKIVLDQLYAAFGSGGGAGLPSTVVTKTATYTAAANDFVKADATSGSFTVTLPAAPAVGALVAVKRTDSVTANTVTVAPSGGGTIDGDPSASIVAKNAGGVFEHVGSNTWQIVAVTSAAGPTGPTGPTGPAATVAVGTVTTGTAGGSASVTNSGTSSAAVLDMTIPRGAAGSNGTNGAISQIQDEGTNLTVRGTVDFVGAGVTASDDAANSRTLVTIPGSGGSSAGQRDPLPTASVPGVYAHSFPRYTPSVTGTVMVTNVPKIVAMNFVAGEIITSLNYLNGSQALATGTHQWAAVCDTSGTVLAISADGTSSAWAANTVKSFAMGSPYTVPTTGTYYLVLNVAASTMPSPPCIGLSGNLFTNLSPFSAASSASLTGTPPSVGANLGQTIIASSSVIYCAVA